MKQVNFIIATPSYLLNKGLSLIINEIRNAKVAQISETADGLESSLSSLLPDYLVITDSLLQKFDDKALNGLYKASPETMVIRILTNDEDKPSQKLNLTDFKLYTGKKETSDFFINLVEKNQNKTGETDSELSERERTILRQVAMGKTNKEIADELFLSIHTVITHRKNITGKLGIKSISGLTVYALINGIISTEDVEY